MPTLSRGPGGPPVTRALTGALQEPASGAEEPGSIMFARKSAP